MTKVRALKTREDAERVTVLLHKHYGLMYEHIWRFALNVGLRMGDVLSISKEDARKALISGYLEIKEQKTKKYNNFQINAGAKEIIMYRLNLYPDSVWLFQSDSNRAKKLSKPLSRQSVYKAIVAVGDMINVKLGTHSARKTRARIMLESGYNIEQISAVLNHSSTWETKAYLDITQEDKNKTYHEVVF